MKKSKSEEDLSTALKDVLFNEFQKRQAVNSRYTIRAFARQLGADHSYLKRLFDGDRGISYVKFMQFAIRGGISDKNFSKITEQFNKTNTKRTLMTFLTKEQYLFLYNVRTSMLLAIVSALKPKYDCELLSELSGYSKTEVKSIIETSIEMGFLAVTKDGFLKRKNREVREPIQLDSEMKDVRNKTFTSALDTIYHHLERKFKGEVHPHSSFHLGAGFEQNKQFFTDAVKEKLIAEQAKLIEKVTKSRASEKKGAKKKASYLWMLNIVPSWEEN